VVYAVLIALHSLLRCLKKANEMMWTVVVHRAL